MASDVKRSWGELKPGEIIVAEEDFALMLVVSDDGWPEQWLWMNDGYIGSFDDIPNRHTLAALFEGRAIISLDGHVRLCHRGSTVSGWCDRALEWWRGAL
jgi:hypothetical protein